MNKESAAYKSLCTQYYELDKPIPPTDALKCYLKYAKEAKGKILEPMCGTGRFLIPLLEQGYSIVGFDSSPHMLEVCRKKCASRQLVAELSEDTFESFSLAGMYNLIFIPSGSFGHLITQNQVDRALKFVVERLNSGGKFVFEIETLKSVCQQQEVWKGRWVNRPDGSKIVLHVLSRFNSVSQIQQNLYRYELWEANKISKIEVEDYQLRYYELAQMESLLLRYGLKTIAKWQAEPHTMVEASDTDSVVLFECVKK